MAADDPRIEQLETRKAQIEAEIARRQARLRADLRKADTRRKVLIGALVMQEMERRAEVDGWVRRLLGERLDKPRDRALFGLAPKDTSDRLAS